MRDAPPIFFLRHQKENAPRPVEKKKCLAAALHIRAKLLYGSRREMVPAGLRWVSDGRGGVRCRFDGGFPRRGYRRHRVARMHLTSSSFRAFRCATRCLGGCGGLCRLPLTSRPAAAEREAVRCDNHPDDLRTIRHGMAATGIAEEYSVPEGKSKSEQAPIRRLPSARRATAPERVQAIFSLPPGAAHSLFVKNKKRMGGAPPWERPPGGSQSPGRLITAPTAPPEASGGPIQSLQSGNPKPHRTSHKIENKNRHNLGY